MFTEFIQPSLYYSLETSLQLIVLLISQIERDNEPQAHLLRVDATDEGRHDRVYLDRCRNSDFVRS